MRVIALAAAFLLAAVPAFATTITVPSVLPNGTQITNIQQGINAAAPGDTVFVKDSDGNPATPEIYQGQVIINKAVALRGENKGVTIAATAAMDRSDLVSIRSGNCAVDTFTLQGGWQAIGTRNGDYTMYANVKLLNLDIRGKPAFGIWFFGDGWLIQFIDIDGISSRGTNTAAYMRGWGRNHILRDIDMYGTNIPDDLRPSSGTDFAHLDGLQTWNQNGEIFENILMERIMLTDFVQGTFLGNEVGDSRAYNGFTLRDFVFWGTNFSSGGSNNLLGSPSHGAYAGKWGTVRNFLYEYGLIYSCSNYLTFARIKDPLITRFLILTGDSSTDGTTYAWEGMTSAQRALVTRQNLDWNTGWDGGTASPNDTTDINPQIGRPAQGQRTIDFLRGPDGKSFTADDGWIPKNPAAKAFGPRVSGIVEPPADTTPPTITLIGANPLPVAFGATFTDPGATVTDNVDATRTIQGVGNVNTGNAGNYTRTYNANDAAGNPAATVTRTVIVQSAPIPPDPDPDFVTQDELNAAINTLRQQMIQADSAEATARVNGDDALGRRIDNLPVPSTEAQIKLWIDTAIKAQPKQTVTFVAP